jgi:DNA segregation ATPase FtsK/SpoIIIE, S-DNA-T family
VNIIRKMGTAKKRTKGRSAASAPSGGLPRPWSEFLGVALLAVGVLMAGGLVSYQAGDGTLMGPVGHLVAAATYASFGMAAYLVTLGIFGVGLKALLGQGMEISLGEGLGFSVATLAGCVLLHVSFPEYRVHGYTAGGLAGELVGEVCLGLFHHAGTYLVAVAMMCVGLLASTPLSAEHLIAGGRAVGRGSAAVGRYLWTGIVDLIRSQREATSEDAGADASLDDTWEDEDPSLDEDVFEDEEAEDDACEEEEEYEEEEEEDEYEEEEEEEEEEDEYEEEEEEEEEDEEDECEDEAPATRAANDAGPSKKGRKTSEKASKPKAASDDLPEIVVGVDAEATGGADKKAANGKKAPPRPEALAKQGPPKAGQTPAGGGTEKKRDRMPGVIRLTEGDYELPPLHLFEAADKVEAEIDRNFVLEQAQRLVTALAEFRIKGKVTKIHPGPVITRYEFKPEAGVKLSKIESLENDIAMALEAIRIRILAPIPGKATVGFEVPNKSRETVYIKEILGDENFGEGTRLPLALGKDITGKITITDLAKAPHLLVAGATGSGKSVGVNSMICSLMYRCSPEDVRMIMIDPKMLELSIYEGIPHLLLPVVTDPEKAALALRWAVQEMERRYAMLSEAQVRDIAGYNRKLPDLVNAWEVEKRQIELAALEAARDAAEHGEESVAGSMLPGVSVDAEGGPIDVTGGVELPERPTKLPYIVVIIDEFADLMMVSSKEVEQCVARIAAKARAAGIHLILATQRPSVDVITGTIKNNFPSRIAFQVTSDADSRTILDGKGAKQLLGMGDMLHMDRGTQANRVHGCFVSEDEILEVVKFVKRQAKPVYNMDIVRKRDDAGGDGDPDDGLDPLYDRAVEIVAEAQKVSTSMLQRRLGIGYNRSARIVEAMEERGVIGPARGTTPREVFVSAA